MSRTHTSTLGNADRSGLYPDTRQVVPAINEFATGGTFYPQQFGGVPDGVTDSTEALQDCFDAAASVGGTVDLGTGDNIWCYSSQIGLSTPSQAGTRITSQGGGGRSSGTPRLRFTGDDAAVAPT
jgi:hypothetical protein